MPVSAPDSADIDRFLVWVAPVFSNTSSSSSVYKPFADMELLISGQQEAEIESDLYVLCDSYKTTARVA